jgi:hypothetical protein
MPSSSSNAFDVLPKTKKDVVKREIARLLDVDFIKEVYLLDWLANLVLVPKKNKDWSMCVNYTNLNKAYKKDLFGLPQIDQVVDSMIGCSLLSFLDCYLRYHLIPLKVKDQIKTYFITPFGAFFYNNAIWTQNCKGNIPKGYTKVSP